MFDQLHYPLIQLPIILFYQRLPNFLTITVQTVKFKLANLQQNSPSHLCWTWKCFQNNAILHCSTMIGQQDFNLMCWFSPWRELVLEKKNPAFVMLKIIALQCQYDHFLQWGGSGKTTSCKDSMQWKGPFVISPILTGYVITYISLIYSMQ